MLAAVRDALIGLAFLAMLVIPALIAKRAHGGGGAEDPESEDGD